MRLALFIIAGFLLYAGALTWVFGPALSHATPPLVENCSASGKIVWGAAQLPIADVEGKKYLLVIREARECVVEVDKQTYEDYTETLGRTWDR